MATLRRGSVTVTVPDETVEDYVVQGWVRADDVPVQTEKPDPAPKRRPRSRSARK